MKVNDLHALAGKPEWYPELDKLIEVCAHDLTYAYGRTQALRMVRDVFAGLTTANVRGYISVGDEHEWARVAIRANEGTYKPPWADLTDEQVGDIAVASGYIEDTREARDEYLARDE